MLVDAAVLPLTDGDLAKAVAEKHEYDTDPDHQLMALGAANLATSAVQGFSVGGSQTEPC